jgi:hypothetical protein
MIKLPAASVFAFLLSLTLLIAVGVRVAGRATQSGGEP